MKDAVNDKMTKILKHPKSPPVANPIKPGGSLFENMNPNKGVTIIENDQVKKGEREVGDRTHMSKTFYNESIMSNTRKMMTTFN